MVRTEQGKALILYNLKDAIRQLPDNLGFQCHRSYWVAKQSIVEFKKQGRQGVLIVNGAEEVPISRRFMPAVMEQL